jgi:aryl-alcohol dehydrogenase-like predicted oxidoreductase
MGKKITRKEFVTKTIGGIAGMGMISLNAPSGSFAAAGLRKVGTTGIMVTPVCFGATRTNEPSLIKYTIDKGINFIDTGRAYANGKNEILVGGAIAGIRQKVVIQSKIRLEEQELPSRGKGKKGADEIKKSLSSKLEASLKALNTDYIDIMLYHDAIDEKLVFHPAVLKFFSEMKSGGVLKACGFSAHNTHLNLAERNNQEHVYDTIMVPFNHKGSFVHSQTGEYSEWNQEKLLEVLTEAGKKGIGIVAMKTCSGGKYSPSPEITPSFREAVNWVLKHDFISAAAVAMSSFDQVDAYLG